MWAYPSVPRYPQTFWMAVPAAPLFHTVVWPNLKLSQACLVTLVTSKLTILALPKFRWSWCIQKAKKNGYKDNQIPGWQPLSFTPTSKPQHPWQLTQVVFFKPLLCLFSPTGQWLPITVGIQVLASWFGRYGNCWPHDHDEYTHVVLDFKLTGDQRPQCTSMSTSLCQNELFDLRRLG